MAFFLHVKSRFISFTQLTVVLSLLLQIYCFCSGVDHVAGWFAFTEKMGGRLCSDSRFGNRQRYYATCNFRYIQYCATYVKSGLNLTVWFVHYLNNAMNCRRYFTLMSRKFNYAGSTAVVTSLVLGKKNVNEYNYVWLSPQKIQSTR